MENVGEDNKQKLKVYLCLLYPMHSFLETRNSEHRTTNQLQAKFYPSHCLAAKKNETEIQEKEYFPPKILDSSFLNSSKLQFQV